MADNLPLCASCGEEICIDWVIQPSLCPVCEDKIQRGEHRQAYNRQLPLPIDPVEK